MERLFGRKTYAKPPYSLEIVIVPAIGLIGPLEWGPWVKTLHADAVPNAQIWEFKYSSSNTGSLAQKILAEGHTLLEALYDHCGKPELENSPIVFICHSIGGFVLKKALCIAREQHYNYRKVIDVISGGIFLGCPHFVTDQNQAKKTLDHLVKCQAKGFGRNICSERDVEALMDICKSFELVNLKVPVVSVYESRETSTQKSVFAKWRKDRSSIVVTSPICQMKGNFEIVVDGESNHFDVCKIKAGSSAFDAVTILFKEVIRDAPKKIAEAFGPYAVPTGLKNDTLRSPSTIAQTRVTEDESENVRQGSFNISSPSGATGASTGTLFVMLPVPAPAFEEETTKDPRLPCFSLSSHEKMEQFCGREDILRSIDETLLPSPQKKDREGSRQLNKLRSFAICGLGGMGKTEVAVEYAYSRRDHFEAVFWISADDANILAENFARIAQQLGLEGATDAHDLAASRRLVNRWLSQPLRSQSRPESGENEVQWLLIYDNVDNIDVLREYWPVRGRGSVLVTSRDPLAKQTDFTGDGIDLPPLSIPESVALMEHLTHRKTDASQQNALSAIAERLGGLPLAISQWAGFIRRLRISYSDFLKLYDTEGIEQLQAMQGTSSDSEKASSLATTWALDGLSPTTKALLQVMCVIDPDHIPEDMLVEYCGEVKLKEYPKGRAEYYSARAELLQSSLINQNVEQKQLSLHRLVQDTTKSMMNKDQLFAILHTAVALVTAAWPFQSMKEYHSVARFDKCKPIFPSVLRLKNGLEPLIQNQPNFPLDIRIAKLFNDTGWYLLERGLIEQLRPFCSLALVVGERMGGSAADDEEIKRVVRESHSFLGIAATETNQRKESMYHKIAWLDSLLQRESTPGVPTQDYELGYAYNEVGIDYANSGSLEEAANAFLLSIKTFQSLDDYEDTMLGWPETNLGFIYWMQGKLDDAERVLVEILDIHAAAWGIDDTRSFKTGKILYALGNVLEAQGRYEESLTLHIRCLNQYKKVLGDGHHRTGDVCHRLAGHCIRKGAYAQAEAYLDQALRNFGGRPHLCNELARTTFKRGKLYELLGQDLEAKETLQRAYNLRKKIKPYDHRPLGELKETDFDFLVAFWSR